MAISSISSAAPVAAPEPVTIVVTSDGQPVNKIDAYLRDRRQRIVYLVSETLKSADGMSLLWLVTAGRIVIDRILINHSIADWADTKVLTESGVTPERVVHHDYEGSLFVTTRPDTWETAIRRS